MYTKTYPSLSPSPFGTRESRQMADLARPADRPSIFPLINKSTRFPTKLSLPNFPGVSTSSKPSTSESYLANVANTGLANVTRDI